MTVPTHATAGTVRFEVLGPLRAVSPGVPTAGKLSWTERPIGGPKQQLVLALLLAQPNGVVSVDRLIEGVWGESAPETARHTLQVYVSKLRAALGPVIRHEGSGYVVAVDPQTLDVLDFESRVAAARSHLDPDPTSAATELDAALALWRGHPFEDFPDQPLLAVEAARLEELHLVAVEALMSARVELGDHEAVVVELEALTAQHPYREGLRALQMLALYRSGRQADALRAFQATRGILAEELGIEPSPPLRHLEEQILLQDPDLDTRTPRAAAGIDERPENPYVGLRPFRERDAARFFGQESLVDSLLDRVRSTATFTALVGPSGSGKSSVVGAGLIPRLRHDAPAGRIAVMQPGSQPFAELESVLAPLSRSADRPPSFEGLRARETGLLEAAIRLVGGGPDERLLLVVDQFEELFTLVADDEATRFLASLAQAAGDPRARVHVLVAMRADFYDRPLRDLRFGPLFAANVVNVVPLGPEQLEAAATNPARQVDVTIEPRLVHRLVADVSGQPNALPLFQYALTELYDERRQSILDLATYERIGGVRRVVAQRAESLFAGLDGVEQRAAQQLFLRIATVSGEAVGRRRVPASELTSLDVDIVALQAVIDAFTRRRLLVLDRDATTGSPTVEVAHDALLTEWDRLREWIAASRDDLATHARFVVAVNEWIGSGRDRDYLLAGSRLDDYRRWAGASQLKRTESEQAFLDESIEAAEAENASDRERVRREARLRRRSRWQLATLVGVLVLLVAAILVPILTADESKGTIAVVLDAPREIGAVEELMARGLENAARSFDRDAVVLEPPYGDVNTEIDGVADEAELVFGAVSVLAPRLSGIAPMHPDTTFVIVDSSEEPELANEVDLSFAHEEGGFLVGAAAALESETGRVGYIGANPAAFIEEFRAGFEQGARAARPDIEVVSTVIGSDVLSGYADPTRAEQIARWMFVDEGVDVVFVAAGSSGAGAIEAATELNGDLGRPLWVVGVDSDQVFELTDAQREHLLTSMIKRLDLGIETVVSAHDAGTLVVPGALRLGVAEGAVGYSPNTEHLGAGTRAALADYERGIVDGSIVVPRRPTGTLREPPPAPEAPDSPATRDALDTASSFVDPLFAGDVEAAIDAVAVDASIAILGSPLTREQLELYAVWRVAARSRLLDPECAAYGPSGAIEIRCTFEDLLYASAAVGAPAAEGTMTLTVGDGSVTSVKISYARVEVLGNANDPFEAWMAANHPDDAAAVTCCGWETLEQAQHDGALRASYVDEWAAYLEERGCTYDVPC